MKFIHAIQVKTSFIGFHRWKDAPEDVAYLREWHRHKFGVEVSLFVDRGDRAVEFHTFLKFLNRYLSQCYENKHFALSCEQIAEALAKYLILSKYNVRSVAVDEDGENTGIAAPDRVSQFVTGVGFNPATATLTADLAPGEEIPPPEQIPSPKLDWGGTLPPQEPPTPNLKDQIGAELEAHREVYRTFVNGKCCVGVEAEGRLRGSLTFFVPGSTAPEVAQRAWGNIPASTRQDIHQIYYGAGNDLKVRADTFIALHYLPHYSFLTVEIESLKSEDAVIIAERAAKIKRAALVSRDAADENNPLIHAIKSFDRDAVIIRITKPVKIEAMPGQTYKEVRVTFTTPYGDYLHNTQTPIRVD